MSGQKIIEGLVEAIDAATGKPRLPISEEIADLQRRSSDLRWNSEFRRGVAVSMGPIRALEASLRRIIAANKSFRDTMPPDWEGDILQDACEDAVRMLDGPDSPSS